MRKPRPQSTAAHAKHIEQLAAAVDAHRDGNPGRRLSRELRAQVVAVIEAGAPVGAVREACRVSGSQITRWRQAAANSGSGGDAAPCSTAASASPRVLSVVDRGTPQDTLLDGEIELRIGGWHVSLRRVVA
jgi:transposase-like protein